MDFLKELDRAHSRATTGRIVDYVGNDPERFTELMELFLKGPYRITQRAAWPLSYCVEDHPELIEPWLARILKYVQKPDIHDAVKRNTMRLLQFIKIPSKYQGLVLEICTGFLRKDEPIAVKVFSLGVLSNICEDFPELKGELKLMIENQLPYASAGFKARARNILKKLEK